jgi:hypothetical protein
MAVRDFVTVYILGYVCFEGDMVGSSLRSGPEMKEIGKCLCSTILSRHLPMKMEVGGFYRTQRYTLAELQTNHPLDRGLAIALQCLGAKMIEFGYYGHRFILCITSPINSDQQPHLWFQSEKDNVASVHAAVRRLVLSDSRVRLRTQATDAVQEIGDPPLTDGELHDLHQVTHVYTYPLIVVPDAVNPLEYDKVDGPGHDRRLADLIFTDRNTSFGLFLREFEPPRMHRIPHEFLTKRFIADFPFILLFRKHYVKMTTQATWVLLDGWGIGEEVLDDLIDALFVGGLHRNAKSDFDYSLNRTDGRSRRTASRSFYHTNEWTYELLSSVFNLTHNFVQSRDTERLRVLLTVAGFFITFTAILLKRAIEEHGEPAGWVVVGWLLVMGALGLSWNFGEGKFPRFRLVRRWILAFMLLALPLGLTGVWICTETSIPIVVKTKTGLDLPCCHGRRESEAEKASVITFNGAVNIQSPEGPPARDSAGATDSGDKPTLPLSGGAKSDVDR